MIYAKNASSGLQLGSFLELWPRISVLAQNDYAASQGFSTVLATIAFEPLTHALQPVAVYALDGEFYSVVVVERSMDDIKVTLLARSARQRAALERGGITYTFPDGDGTIQTRNDTDIRNVQAQVLAALILKIQGVTAAVMGFRDAENATHLLTPDETIAMGMTVSAQISAGYAAKWALDGAIGLLDTAAAAIDFADANAL